MESVYHGKNIYGRVKQRGDTRISASKTKRQQKKNKMKYKTDEFNYGRE